jgi:hypothetical protein
MPNKVYCSEKTYLRISLYLDGHRREIGIALFDTSGVRQLINFSAKLSI